MARGRVLIIATVLTLVGALASGCGGSSPSSSEVAAAAGASSCDNSGYYLIIRATGEHETIYDCSFASGEKCVTYQGGIANDSTEAVRLVFSNTLGATKPTCLSG